MRRAFVLPLAALALAILTACRSDDGADQDGALVVGVQAEELAVLLGSVHVVVKLDGAVTEDSVVQAPAGLPKEIDIKGKVGARVEVIVDGFGAQPAQTPGDPPLVSRRALARLVASPAKKLLRMQLEGRCAVPPVQCGAEETCAGGRCVSIDLPETELEDYEPGWAAAPPDVCRPKNHGAPEVILGQGQTDWAPLGDGQTLQLEKGPQGGHHLWIALRMKNLRQTGSRTVLTAKIADAPASPVLPAAYVFSFERDEGDFCKLFGLRFQLDSGAADLTQDYKRFLGRRLEIRAEVVDTTGGRASATKTISVSDKLLCADGTTTSCNPP